MGKENKGGDARKTIRWIMIIVAVAFSVLTIVLEIAPFGATVTYRTDLRKNSSKVTITKPFTTKSILTSNGEGQLCQIPQLMMESDIVEFKVKVPYSSVSNVDVKLKYKGNPNELLLGVMDASEGSYIYKPVNNKIINALTWESVTSNGATLFEKEKKYQSFNEFLEAIPLYLSNEARVPGTRICSYFYSLPQPKDPEIVTSKINSGTQVNSSLRGLHKFYVYIKDKPLDIEFNEWELNSVDGVDDLEVKIRSINDDGKVVYYNKIEDDGDITAKNKASDHGKTEVKVQGLHEGVYSVELICGSDVVIKNLRSVQRYLVFEGSVLLADHELYKIGPTKSAVLFFKGNVMGMQIWHQESVQTAYINDSQPVSLYAQGVSQDVSVELPQQLNKIDFEMGDIQIKTPGNFISFSKESYFDPFPVKVSGFNQYFNSLVEDYLVTTYVAPEIDGEYFVQDVSVDMTGVPVKDGFVNFTLKAPESSMGERGIEIGEIQIEIKK
ncbi:MAG: hypothetical protein JW738_09575 [Actinobacteria bacterium]|nr:hypothetical protein [Actinomycetota bacterium]